MNTLEPIQKIATNQPKSRRPFVGIHPTVFTNIYCEDTNIVIWQRKLSKPLTEAVAFYQDLCQEPQTIEIASKSASAQINEIVGVDHRFAELSKDIAELVDMFCCLFDLKRVGLRITPLDRAMCPKFHVDRVPCRLVTTYHGGATEWLPHQAVDRSKLGAGSNGKSDEQSGIFANKNDIQQLNTGDVALLKGELWQGNENAGLVHRSPSASKNDNRLLLTLDFIG